MTKTATKIAASAMSATMLLASGAAAALPALAVADEGATPAMEQQAATQGEAVRTAAAEGSFSFTQTTHSTIEYIRAVFMRAASLCENSADYQVRTADGIIAVTGPNGTFYASID